MQATTKTTQNEEEILVGEGIGFERIRRITGYLVKRSEIEKLEKGENVLQDTTALGMGAKHNGHILERKVR